MARRPTSRGWPAVLALIAAALALAACGGDSDREKVERFIEDSNEVQARAAPALRRANAAYRRFATGELSAQQAVAANAQSERLIGSLRGEVAELDPPAQARRLKELLLRVFDANARVAEETTLTAGYLVAQQRVVARLRRLGRDLRGGLRGTPEAQARGLERYADGLEGVLARLRRLRAPVILASERRDQLDQLAGSRRIVLRLRSAILGRDSAAVVRLLDRLERIGARQPSAGLTRAAARRYTRLLRRISLAQADAQAEVGRLNRALD